MLTVEKRLKFAILCILRAYTEPGYVHQEDIKPNATQQAFAKWAKGWLSGADQTKESSDQIARLVRQHAHEMWVAVNPELAAHLERGRLSGADILETALTGPPSKSQTFCGGPYAIFASSHDEAIALVAAQVAELTSSWVAGGRPDVAKPNGWHRSAAEVVRRAAYLDWDLDPIALVEQALA